MITSSQNPKIKLVRALGGQLKTRRKEGAFLAEGVRLVEEVLAAGWPIRLVLYAHGLNKRGNELVEKLQVEGSEVEEVAPNLMKSLSETKNSQGILAVLDHFQLPIPNSPNFILILDQIRDPGNLGTLLRTATAAGVQAVLLPPETTDAFAPKVVRAGMGAHFWLPIQTISWDEIEQVCITENLQVFLADMNGDSCWETDFQEPMALIVGSEAEGASQPARELVTTMVSIPMLGGTESLNASIAGAVLMFEVVRQRL